MLTKTKPKMISPGLEVRILTDIEVAKYNGDWWLKSYHPVRRTKEYKKMWRYVRAANSMNTAVDMSHHEFMRKVAEFTRFIAVDKDDALRMLLLIEKIKTEQDEPSLINRLVWFKEGKELPF
jgi:hypothetical protein